jgi:hypothetical protein
VAKKRQHVVPNGEKWSVKTAGASRASSTFKTQAEAIKAATRKAKKEGTELYVHGRDGRIRERNSYGHDPHPPKG